MVIGDRKKFLSMIVTLKSEINPEDGAPKPTLAHHVKSHFER